MKSQWALPVLLVVFPASAVSFVCQNPHGKATANDAITVEKSYFPSKPQITFKFPRVVEGRGFSYSSLIVTSTDETSVSIVPQHRTDPHDPSGLYVVISIKGKYTPITFSATYGMNIECQTVASISLKEVDMPHEPGPDVELMPPHTGRYSPSWSASYRRIKTPSYPAEALKKGIDGTVHLRVSILEDGSVSYVKIEYVTPPSAVLLVDGLIDTVRTWKFNSKMDKGIAKTSDVIVPISFAINSLATPATTDTSTSTYTPVLEVIEVVGKTLD